MRIRIDFRRAPVRAVYGPAMSIKSSERMVEEAKQLTALAVTLEEAIRTLHNVLSRESEVPFSLGRDAMHKYERARADLRFRVDNLLVVEDILDPDDDALEDVLSSDDDDDDDAERV